jgi:integrase
LSIEQTEAAFGQNHAQETSSGESANRIYQVTDGLRSKHTKKAYLIAFNQFLKDGAKIQDLQVLLDHKPRVLEQMIIGYVENLRDKGKAHKTIQLHVAAILHFFVTLNDVPLNKRKITRFIPSDDDESAHSDKAYDIDDILRLLNASDIRTKVMVYLMASSGMRQGALPGLLYGNLTLIPEHNLYQIEVYATSKKWRYITYCTPECRQAIYTYLNYRRRLGEDITEETPLIRELFSPSNPFTINAPKRCTDEMVIQSLEKALHKSGVNQRSIALQKGKRRSIMRSHGFRKFALTRMKKAGIDFSDRHALLGHKSNISNDLNYDRTEYSDRLLAYVKAIPLLTINPNQRLVQENQQLKKASIDYLAELGDLKEEFNEMKQMLVGLKNKGNRKNLVREFFDKANDRLQDEQLA